MGRRLKRIIICTVLAAGFFFLAGFSPAAADEKPFGGVGLQVVPTVRGELVVLLVVPGSPASMAGLEPGDLIVQVDDFPLAGSDFTEVVSRYLWGEPGTSVTLRYLRPGVEGRKTVNLRRVPIEPDAGKKTPGVELMLPGRN